MKLNTQLVTKADVVPVALVLQSLNVLSLNAEELQKSVEEFVSSNPVVDYRPASSGTFDPESVADSTGKEFGSLFDHIEFQLGVMTNDAELFRIGTIIAGCLDRNGYLRDSEEEMVRTCGCSVKRYREALELVRSCDPVGIAASDLSECLTLQLKAMDDPAAPLAIEIVRDHLYEMAEGRVCMDDHGDEEIEDACDLIRSLNPRPGSGYETEAINYIMPDVLIEDDGSGGLQVSLINQPPCPVLFENYRDYLKTEDETEKEYIRANLAKARSFIYAIKQREQTVFSIANLAVQRQAEYLRTGDVSKLRPLTMAACAKLTKRSISTVSRCVGGKYAEYKGRLMLLKTLFTSGGVGQASREFIVERIRSISAQQPTASDREITDALNAEGIEISRRTVNKYRNLYVEEK